MRAILVACALLAGHLRGGAAAATYYEMLGIEEDASERQIKRAFRRLSLKYHPDKCKEESCQERFVEASSAYEVLSDPHKRRQYDRFGEEGLKDEGPGAGGAPMDPFEMFFGGGRRQQPQGPPRGPDTVVPLRVSLRDLYEGSTIAFAHHKRKVCTRCHGSGAYSKDHYRPCPVCGGRGVRIIRRQLGPGFVQQIQTECDHCHGSGRVVSKQCPACSGHGIVDGKEEVEAVIERGMADGAEITFERGGDEQTEQRAGHLVFRVVAEPHPVFTRDGDDLHADMTLSLLESLVGVSRPLKHLDGHDVLIERSGVTRPDQEIRVRGEGMPNHEDSTEFGDLFVHIAVQFPAELTPAQRQAIEQVL